MFTLENHTDINEALLALVDGESDALANVSNAAALLYHSMKDINWAGFYFLKGNNLVLGPFQGKPACVRIPLGKGVCGTAALKRQTVIVPDVHLFPGHIACDGASMSEIVVPIIKDGQLIGVLDIDSPIKNRFLDTEKLVLEDFIQILIKNMDVLSLIK